MIKFYDTCSLLKKTQGLFDEHFYISSITLKELENIKTSMNKDAEVKFRARKLLHELEENYGSYSVVIFEDKFLDYVKDNSYPLTDDIRILCSALSLEKHSDLEFITNDLSFKFLARMFFENVSSVGEYELDNYLGYKEVVMTDEELAFFYENPSENKVGANVNEYMLIKSINDPEAIIDVYFWNSKIWEKVTFNNFDSEWFGKVKPIDSYQIAACDTLRRNKVSLIKGLPGSGKSFLSVGYLLHQLEKGKIDKIVMFCNPIATRGAAKLGYYPGNKDDKLLDSQVGNLLSSKLGGRMAVELLISQEKLVLLPFSDIRGYDTSGMRAGIYISEAQNLSIDLMKLALQRIGEDSICIIDGDADTQLDDIIYAGENNGMRRLSQVFRGQDFYGEVKLNKIHRSKIAEVAELM